MTNPEMPPIPTGHIDESQENALIANDPELQEARKKNGLGTKEDTLGPDNEALNKARRRAGLDTSR